MDLFVMENLSFSYPHQKSLLLNNINICIQEGEFVVICGESGSGKSTLIKHFMTAVTPRGESSGTVFFKGTPLCKISIEDQASEISYVPQGIDYGFFTSDVLSEMSLGSAILGKNFSSARLSISEVCNILGISNLIGMKISELSSGQRQLVKLAAAIVTKPDVLILDDPLSQLDPVSSDISANILKKLNTDFSITIIMSSKNTKNLYEKADRLLLIKNGNVCSVGSPKNNITASYTQDKYIFDLLPPAMKLYLKIGITSNVPIDTNSAKKWFQKICLEKDIIINKIEVKKDYTDKKPLLSIENIWFRYSRRSNDILKNASLHLHEGEILSIAGNNGSGKSTLLKLICGILKPYKGKILIDSSPLGKYIHKDIFSNQIAAYTSDSKILLVHGSVADNLFATFGYQDNKSYEDALKLMKLFNIESLLTSPVVNLSPGIKQCICIIKAIIMNTKILVLDEPTSEMDSVQKKILGKILNDLSRRKTCIVIASHDIDFCSQYATSCAVLFDGSFIGPMDKNEFFSSCRFYTTDYRLITSSIFSNAVCLKEVLQLCLKNGIIKNTTTEDTYLT